MSFRKPFGGFRAMPLSDPQVARFYQDQIGLGRPATEPGAAARPVSSDQIASLNAQVEELRGQLATLAKASEDRVRSVALEAAKDRTRALTRMRETLEQRDRTIESLKAEMERTRGEMGELDGIVRQLQDLLQRKEKQISEMMNDMRGLLRVALCTPSTGDD